MLGAAAIAPAALVDPARQVEGAEAWAVASRDVGRAERFAEEHGVSRVYPDYDAMLASDEVDAVYNALPNGLHCEWTLRALRAGKPVLCEKPIASNADEARRMAEAASEADLLLMEAFHYRYHPLVDRVGEILASGVLGPVREVSASFSVPFPAERASGDIRFDYSLGGGATMDLGCYPIHVLRHVTGEEPEVIHAQAKTGPPGVDVEMSAELRFPSGTAGRVSCAMTPDARLVADLEVRGDDGTLKVLNPLAPHIGNRVEVEAGGSTSSESVEGDATYVYQLRAFLGALEHGYAVPTDASDAIANMRVIDAVYRAASLPLRGAG
jgi:predicted dehydrogenase